MEWSGVEWSGGVVLCSTDTDTDTDIISYHDTPHSTDNISYDMHADADTVARGVAPHLPWAWAQCKGADQCKRRASRGSG